MYDPIMELSSYPCTKQSSSSLRDYMLVVPDVNVPFQLVCMRQSYNSTGNSKAASFHAQRSFRMT